MAYGAFFYCTHSCCGNASVCKLIAAGCACEQAVVSESAFWISDLLTFLEVPEDLRLALSTQRLVRLNEMQHPSSTAVLAGHQPDIAPVAASLDGNDDTSAMVPLLISSIRQVRAR